MSDERFDFKAMSSLDSEQLRDALASRCPRTVRRAEYEVSRRHRARLAKEAAQNRARVLAWLSLHEQRIVDAFLILLLAGAILFDLFLFVAANA